MHANLHRGDAAQAVAQGGVAIDSHAGVRNRDGVAGEFIAVFFQKPREMFAADLLLALDEENHIHGQ